jgi:hypothetical protein
MMAPEQLTAFNVPLQVCHDVKNKRRFSMTEKSKLVKKEHTSDVYKGTYQ